MATRFFQQPGGSEPRAVALDASDRQGGYVHALALAIVDRLVSRNFTDMVSAGNLLEPMRTFFPQSIPQATHANAIETLELMTSTPQKASQTALELMWVLRHVMVNRMSQTPVNYLPAFYQHGNVLSPSDLEAQGAHVDKVGLKALAKLLNITVILHQTEKNKQLPAKFSFGNGQMEIHIDRHDGRFTPRVQHPEAFRPLASKSGIHSEVNIDFADNEHVVNQVHALLQRVEHANKENTHWLENMLDDGSMTVDDLLTYYIHNAPSLTWQVEFVKEATDIKTLLVSVAATMVSFGITSREALFEEAERHTVSSPTMA